MLKLKYKFGFKYNILLFILLIFPLDFSSAFAQDAPVVSDSGQDQSQPYSEFSSNTSNTPNISNNSNTSTTSAPDTSNMTLQQRVAVLERQMSAFNQIGLMNQVNDLQQQLQELQGQVEELSHTVQTLQTQSASQYADLDQRLTKLGSTASSAAANAGSASDASRSSSSNTNHTNNTTSEQQSYESAYNKIKTGDYTRAITAMKNFLTQYPSGTYAPNAHYWLGQMYLMKGEGKNAGKEFEIVIDQYAQNPKARDASLKLGFALILQGKNNQAKIQFKKVIQHYPNTSTAKLARARLDEMA